MPSPVLEGKYHHPSASPTPSNHQIANQTANSGHSCCGKSFASEVLFKEHFDQVHDPVSPAYLKPADANALAVPSEAGDGPKPFGE
jgi:hypothetical protein